jgi:excisionase family DNA binding protein
MPMQNKKEEPGKAPQNVSTPDDNRFALSMRECADELSVSEKTIWTLINSGKLRAFRVGRGVRILRIELLRFAQSGGAE